MNDTCERRRLIAVLDPISVPADGGEARWWGEGLAVIKATGADTGGQMAIIEITEPPGAEAPLHVHHKEDEAFWILEGEVTFEVGGVTIAATAGDYAFGPRDVPHSYRVGASRLSHALHRHARRIRGPRSLDQRPGRGSGASAGPQEPAGRRGAR